MATIHTVIFDFGNVVGFFDHGRAVARLAAFTDRPPTELALALYGGPLEDAYERGRLSTPEFVAQANADGRLTCTDAEFLAAFADVFWRNDAVCDLIPRLAGRYRLLLASNTTDAHYRTFTAQFADVLGHFAELCTSHKSGHRKPEAEFFAYCQEHAAGGPGGCVFVDDLAVNVAGARGHGWVGIDYRPGLDLAAELTAAGVQVGG